MKGVFCWLILLEYTEYKSNLLCQKIVVSGRFL